MAAVVSLPPSLPCLGAVVIAFVVCWLPYHARRLMFCYVSDWPEWVAANSSPSTFTHTYTLTEKGTHLREMSSPRLRQKHERICQEKKNHLFTVDKRPVFFLQPGPLSVEADTPADHTCKINTFIHFTTCLKTLLGGQIKSNSDEAVESCSVRSPCTW